MTPEFRKAMLLGMVLSAGLWLFMVGFIWFIVTVIL